MEGILSQLLDTRTETRRRRKAERPQEIIEAAFLEFSKNGYAMTTLDQVAERAGVTKGTIYVYFENKEHLFISMVREAVKATMDTVEDMFERHDGSTADLLREQFSFIYRPHRPRPAAARSRSDVDCRSLALSGAGRPLLSRNTSALHGSAHADDSTRT